MTLRGQGLLGEMWSLKMLSQRMGIFIRLASSDLFQVLGLFFFPAALLACKTLLSPLLACVAALLASKAALLLPACEASSFLLLLTISLSLSLAVPLIGSSRLS